MFFGLFVVLNDKLRGWYAALDPTAVRDGIPGAEPGSLEHVESTASMPSINLQRCAPAATALSYASLSNGHPHRAAASGSLGSSAVPMLWERLTTVFALAGPLPAAT